MYSTEQDISQDEFKEALFQGLFAAQHASTAPVDDHSSNSSSDDGQVAKNTVNRSSETCFLKLCTCISLTVPVRVRQLSLVISL